MLNLFGYFKLLVFVPCFVTIVSCNSKEKNTLFTKLSAATTGINFSNDIHDNDSSYSFINEFGYMGGGVGIGDFNNDGLKDIFFSGNQVCSRLYMNKGNNEFADITVNAGVTTNVWCTGVSIVDINNDGYDDIYVCVFGKDLVNRSPNLLFINQHNLTFKEQAAAYGLANTGNSSQAVFFDYDKDGDLDMYLANYLLAANNSNTIVPRDKSGYSPANDKLYRNDGDSANAGHPYFTDVSFAAGIKEDGYGLGVSVSDFNGDGWPDIYVANDFISNDELWLNNKNGTFTNCINEAIQHQSYSSMGVDAADFNNDTLTDIVTLDMLPETNYRKKTSLSFMNYDRYQAERAMGYEPEFMRNMLQLNNGNFKTRSKGIPFFSEIGRLSGVYATDWSWSVLMADFNNDGWKDMHITNGIGRDFIDADFVEFSNTMFNGNLSKVEQQQAIRKKLASLDNVNLPNYLFINNKDLSFSDQSDYGGVNEPSMSNGAAYADLDNDGDLDLVVNNINKAAFILRNNTNQNTKTDTTHYLSFKLSGDSLNKKGFGAKLFLYTNNNVQLQEQNPVRGYFSSVDQQLVFGLGKHTSADSLLVLWPDGKQQVLRNIKADTTVLLSWTNAVSNFYSNVVDSPFLFTDITGSNGFVYKHTDNMFNDFASQQLLLQKYSQTGPFMNTADINNDGETDFFIGGAFNFSGKLFTQKAGQSFISKNLTDSIKFEEDEASVFFDADKDGDNDLLITYGGMQYNENSVYYKPRLYMNDGKGNFSYKQNAIPDSVRTIAGCVTAGDFDNDGYIDLFIGGRVSHVFPASPKSFLLHNNHGIFTDVTATACPALKTPGMITAAVFADFDNDRQVDLIIAGDWMSLQFFKNKNGQFINTTTATGLTQMKGMWRSLEAADVDKDGDLDFIAGNLGLNCEYKVSMQEPMQLFSTDLDGNGSIDPFLFYYIKDRGGIKRSFPAISRARFAERVPSIKKQFLLNADYARADYQDIFKGKPVEKIEEFICNETRTCFFENIGNGKFLKHVLPIEAQFSPVNAIVCDDFDNDGFKDLLLAGNEYQTEVITGRYDASYGCFLRGGSNKSFAAVTPRKSGFVLTGDVKDLSLLRLSNGEKVILAAVNNDSMRVFSIHPKSKWK